MNGRQYIAACLFICSMPSLYTYWINNEKVILGKCNTINQAETCVTFDGLLVRIRMRYVCFSAK